METKTHKTAEEKCEAGCITYTGGEIKHHKDCVFYPESLTKMYDDLKAKYEALLVPSPPAETNKNESHYQICQMFSLVDEFGKPTVEAMDALRYLEKKLCVSPPAELKEIKRPYIKDFLGDIPVQEASEIYHRSEPLFKYAQALDNYIDELQSQPTEKQKQPTDEEIKAKIKEFGWNTDGGSVASDMLTIAQWMRDNFKQSPEENNPKK